MNNKKSIKFYVALWLAKLSCKVLKLLKRNATSFPGDLAIRICPNFLGIFSRSNPRYSNLSSIPFN